MSSASTPYVKTNLTNLGVEYPSQDLVVKEKIKQTNLNNYGVVSVLCLQEIRDLGKEKLNLGGIKEKRKQTNLEKYGVEYGFHKKDIFYNRYFGENGKYSNILIPLFSKEEYIGCDRRNLYKFECKKCHTIFEDSLADGNIPNCLCCYPKQITPKFENNFYDWISSLGLKIFRRDRKQISPLEIDFYLPDSKIGIEFNELRSHCDNKKSKFYHLDKTNLCEKGGIQLIHVFQDEWFFKQDIVKSIILSKLGFHNDKIFARKCVVKEITKEEANNFFNKNHLQGYFINIQTNNFGLFYNDVLFMAVSFCKARYNKNYDYELFRSCSKLNTIIVGGFEKLMKNVTLKGSIISYIDRRYFNGNSYKNWEYVGTTEPNYFYMKNYSNRESRLKYQKHKLPKLFPDVYDINLTEWEIMQLAGYDRIWDCGNIVYSRIL